MPFATRPVIAVTLAYITGCLLAVWSSASPVPAFAAALVVLAAAIYSFGRGSWRWSILLAAVALAGTARTAVVQTPGPWDVSRLASWRGPLIIEGPIASEPVRSSARVSFLLRVHSASGSTRDLRAEGLAQVNLVRDALRNLPELEYGQMLRIAGRIRRPEGPRDPGGFSSRDYLARQGVFAVVWVDRQGDAKPLTSTHGSPAIRWAQSVSRALHRLFQARLPDTEAGLVSGMLLGSYSLVPPDLLEQFTRSGTLHLLAASGFNCALIVLVFWHLLLRPLGAPRVLSLCLVIVLVLFYVLMVGSKPSIVRAGVGASLFLGGMLLGRPSNLLSTLFATAVLILAFDPLSLWDVGFQLSFAAVGSIIAFVPGLSSLAGLEGRASEERGPSRSWWLLPARHLGQVALVTLAATVATLPIIAWYFSRVSLVSLPANMAVAFLAEMLFMVSVAFSAFHWLPGIGPLLQAVVYWLAVAVERVVSAMGGLPYAQMNVESPGLAAVVAWYAVLVAAWWALRGRVGNLAAARPYSREQDPFT